MSPNNFTEMCVFCLLDVVLAIIAMCMQTLVMAYELA
jgi:hypothetical protein